MIFARKTERMEELTPKNQTLEAMGDAVTHAANETLGKFTVKFLIFFKISAHGKICLNCWEPAS